MEAIPFSEFELTVHELSATARHRNGFRVSFARASFDGPWIVERHLVPPDFRENPQRMIDAALAALRFYGRIS